MSNARKLRQPPRPPDGAEAAFRDELRRKGCPHCGSRRVVGRFRDGVWDYGLRCEASCETHADPRLAHAIASAAARAAGAATGTRLLYTAVDIAHGVAGVVRAGAVNRG